MNSDPTFRLATPDDLGTLVRLLADDPLGADREDRDGPPGVAYRDAFDAIEADPNNELWVAVMNGVIVGLLQLTFMPSLTRRGSWRAQVEGVRVAGQVRGEGIGRQLFAHAEARARDRGCGLLQLTTDRSRQDAVRFYERLGFAPSHIGMKREL